MKTRKELFECDTCNCHGFTLTAMKAHNKTAEHVKLTYAKMYVPATQHTPTPLAKVLGSALTRKELSDAITLDDAHYAFIVRAVNSHEELIALVKKLRDLTLSESGARTHMTLDVDAAIAKAEAK